MNTIKYDTKLLGIFGHPIKHSFSPLIHNKALDLLNLDYIYLPFDIGSVNLHDAIKGVIALGVRGFNVTIPHKETIMEYLHDFSDEATMIGAVNTVVNDMGRLIGYNTDVFGINESLVKHKEKFIGEQITVIGSGGAARAVIFCLIRNFRPSQIVIVNRTEQRANNLKRYFKQKMRFENFKAYELFPPEITEVLKDSALIVNATSVGMHPDVDDSPINIRQAFNKKQVVYDLIYNPIKSKLLLMAESEGATVINGLDTLVNQAAKSFKLWTGKEMPINEIKNLLIEELNKTKKAVD